MAQPVAEITAFGDGPRLPPSNKVDTHHHFVPDFYAKAVEEAGGDPSGWHTPAWSVSLAEKTMHQLGIGTAILSVTAPGACILKGKASSDLARKLNEHAAELRNEDPQRFGFFASLPSLIDTEAALEELRYALDELHADGVTLFTRYGEDNTYLGHDDLRPIWAELNRRKCVVFVHPTHPVDTKKVNPKMPQPMIDYPHETTRSATDMILQGTRQDFPDCQVILSHAGGTLPYLITRVATLFASAHELVTETATKVTQKSIMEDLQSFYFDLALASSPASLKLLLELVPHSHILYGSDFPYAPFSASSAFVEQLESFEMDTSLRQKINFGNALALFPKISRSKGL